MTEQAGMSVHSSLPAVVLEQIEYHESGEWAAIYVNGKLADGPGDTYLRDEWLREHFGVKVVQDDGFLLGQETSAGAAKTLEDVHAYIDKRNAALELAAKKRLQAARLIVEADELEGKKSHA